MPLGRRGASAATDMFQRIGVCPSFVAVGLSISVAGCPPSPSSRDAADGATDAHPIRDSQTEVAASANPSDAKTPPFPSVNAPLETISDAGVRIDGAANTCRLIERPAALRGLGATRAGLRRTAEIVADWRIAPGSRSAWTVPVVAPRTARISTPAAEPAAPLDTRGLVPCAHTAHADVCPDRNGVLRVAGAELAHARPGTSVAAAEDRDALVVAYLADKKAGDGTILSAFAVAPGASPVLLSEVGSGATAVDLSTRGEKRGVVAAYLDARRAMMPIHARTLERSAAGVTLGKDAVLFIGGAPETHLGCALARGSDGATRLLVPMGRDTSTFGMAVLAVPDPPTEDVPASWSMYSGALDPSPVAAAGSDGTRIARVVPGPHGSVELEVVAIGGNDVSVIGRLGNYPRILRLAFDIDRLGAFWIGAWTGTEEIVERWVCGAAAGPAR